MIGSFVNALMNRHESKRQEQQREELQRERRQWLNDIDRRLRDLYGRQQSTPRAVPAPQLKEAVVLVFVRKPANSGDLALIRMIPAMVGVSSRSIELLHPIKLTRAERILKNNGNLVVKMSLNGNGNFFIRNPGKSTFDSPARIMKMFFSGMERRNAR